MNPTTKRTGTRLLTLLATAMLCLSRQISWADNVVYNAANLAQSGLSSVTATKLTIQPRFPYSVEGTNIITRRSVSAQFTNGTVTVSNLVAGIYTNTIRDQREETVFLIDVAQSGNQTNVNAHELVTLSTNAPGSTTTYSRTQITNSFIPRTNGWSYNLTNTNVVLIGLVTFPTNNAASNYVWTATNANGRGEWRAAQGGGGSFDGTALTNLVLTNAANILVVSNGLNIVSNGFTISSNGLTVVSNGLTIVSNGLTVVSNLAITTSNNLNTASNNIYLSLATQGTVQTNHTLAQVATVGLNATNYTLAQGSLQTNHTLAMGTSITNALAAQGTAITNALSGQGETNTISSSANSGASLVADTSKVGVDLRLKSISFATNDFTTTTNATNISVVINTNAFFDGIAPGNGITFTTNANVLTVAATGGSATNAVNTVTFVNQTNTGKVSSQTWSIQGNTNLTGTNVTGTFLTETNPTVVGTLTATNILTATVTNAGAFSHRSEDGFVWRTTPLGQVLELTGDGLELNGFLFTSITPTNAGTDAQVLSKTGANAKWIDAGGGSQTPWTSTINGGGYALTNAGGITTSNTIILSNSAASPVTPSVKLYSSTNTTVSDLLTVFGTAGGGVSALRNDGSAAFATSKVIIDSSGNINLDDSALAYKVDGSQVVGVQQAHIPDTDGTVAGNASAITNILTALRAHGLIASPP